MVRWAIEALIGSCPYDQVGERQRWPVFHSYLSGIPLVHLSVPAHYLARPLLQSRYLFSTVQSRPSVQASHELDTHEAELYAILICLLSGQSL